MLYSARARTKTPAAPATPIATPPLGAGAPPVDFEDEAEADAELEPELEPEAELEVVAEEESGKVVWAAFEAVWLKDCPVTVTLEPVSDTVSWVVAGTPIIWASKFEVAHALTLLGRSLNQAGKVPAAAALTTEERKVGFVRISSCHEYGMAVSKSVNTELGIAAIKAAAEAEAAKASDLISVPIESAVAVVSGAGVASAEAAKRRAAKNLCMVIVRNKAKDRSAQKKRVRLDKKGEKKEIN